MHNRNSVVAELIGPLPNQTVVGIVLVVKIFYGGGIFRWSSIQGPSVEIKQNFNELISMFFFDRLS